MKIVYCIAGTFNSGGMERVLTNKANWLAGHGYEVVVVTTDQQNRAPFFPLSPLISCYDLAVNYAENNGKSFLHKALNYPFKQWKHKKRLAALLDSLKADIVISMFNNDASFIPAISDGSQKILEFHFSRFKRLQYGRKGIWRLADVYRSRMDERIVRRYDRFVVLTEEDKGYWGSLPNLRVIPNALSFQPEESAVLEAKKVVAVGRYNYQKGYDYLIDAWKKVFRDFPDWSLDIVGSGELQGELQTRIDDARMGASVCLKPPVSNIEEVYRQASVLAISSRYEGLPMALLEGAAFGLPAVSFACKCGPKDIIRDGENGFLVPVGDTDILADRIMRLVADENLRKRMGQSARENSKRFSESIVMEHWRGLFNELTKEEK